MSYRTPWYLSRGFFSLFFSFTLASIVVTALAQVGIFAFATIYATKQDYSQGVIPVVEKVLCGKPGCLAAYLNPPSHPN